MKYCDSQGLSDYRNAVIARGIVLQWAVRLCNTVIAWGCVLQGQPAKLCNTVIEKKGIAFRISKGFKDPQMLYTRDDQVLY